MGSGGSAPCLPSPPHDKNTHEMRKHTHNRQCVVYHSISVFERKERALVERHRFSLVLDPETMEKVREAARNEGITATVWIKRAIRDRLESVSENADVAQIMVAAAEVNDDGKSVLASVARSLAKNPEFK